MEKNELLIEAYKMKQPIKEVWEYMVRKFAKYADSHRPWREAEIEYLIKESHKVLDKLPETKYTKVRKDKALKLLNRIEGGETDYFVLNNFMDTLHNLWKHDCPNARKVGIYEDVSKEFPKDAWDADEFSEMTDSNFFTPENFPRGKDHTKKQYDVIERRREFFIAKFLEIHGGKRMRDCFWTFLHDIDEADRHGRMNLEHIMKFQEAFDKVLISEKQFSSYVKRAGEEALRWAFMGEHTWEADHEWHYLFEEYHYVVDLLKGRELEQDCATINCRESREYPPEVIDKMKNGDGLELWYCDKHVKDKPRNTHDVREEE